MSNNLTSKLIENSVYLNDLNPPNSISPTAHANLLNETAKTLWRSPHIYQIGVSPANLGGVTFNNEDPLSVTEVTFGTELYGRGSASIASKFTVEMMNGSSVTYSRQYPNGLLSVSSFQGSPTFVIGEQVRVTAQSSAASYNDPTYWAVDSQFTPSLPQFITANTRTLVRNNALGFDSYVIGGDGHVFFDDNRYQLPTGTTRAADLGYNFVIYNDTPPSDIVIELGLANFGPSTYFEAQDYLFKKSQRIHTGLTYINDIFKMYAINDQVFSLYITASTDLEISNAVMSIDLVR